MTISGSPNLIALSLAVLAFVIAFYALVAREHKTPYLVNRTFSATFWLLIVVALETASIFSVDILPSASRWIHIAAQFLVLLTTIWIAWGLLRIHGRQVHLRDDKIFSNFRIFRWLKSVFRRLRPPNYEHNPSRLPDALKTSLLASPHWPKTILAHSFESAGDSDWSILATVIARSLHESEELLCDTITRFLDAECPVQIVSCARHPIELFLRLEKYYPEHSVKKNWKQAAPTIVIVDAFSPHYGFTDSIHDYYHSKLENKQVQVVRARESFAGLHTASARAFNIIKARTRPSVTRPYTLVVYEGVSALADLESREQLRIFFRHVFPSETLWGGMLTLFVECELEKEEINLLRAYSDVFQCKPPEDCASGQ